MSSKFQKSPDDKILNALTIILGFNSYKDKTTIIKNTDLILKNIKQQFIASLTDINNYLYNPIDKDYITTEARCITITRQFLRIKGLDILLIKKMVNGENIKCYKICHKNFRKIKAESNKPKVISFDWD
jgi:hypothetical protein